MNEWMNTLCLTLITQGPLETGENSNTPPGSSFSTITISRLVKPGLSIWLSTFVLYSNMVTISDTIKLYYWKAGKKSTMKYYSMVDYNAQSCFVLSMGWFIWHKMHDIRKKWLPVFYDKLFARFIFWIYMSVVTSEFESVSNCLA